MSRIASRYVAAMSDTRRWPTFLMVGTSPPMSANRMEIHNDMSHQLSDATSSAAAPRSAAPGPHIASVRRAAPAATARKQPKCVSRKALDSAVSMPNTSAACRPSSISASQSCWRSDSRTRRARWWVGSRRCSSKFLSAADAVRQPVTTGIPSHEQGSGHRPVHAPRSPAHATALARAGDARLLGAGQPVRPAVAITETTRLQTGFLAASARMAVVFVLCLHVASSMVREFNDKGVDLLLSLDLPRAGYFFGKLLGFAGLAVDHRRT